MKIIKKSNNCIKKQIIFTILFFMILFLQTNVFGETYRLSDVPEMEAIIIKVVNWHADNPSATTSEIAAQIDSACNGNLETIKKLQHTYVDGGGGTVWPGGNPDSIYYEATDIAIIARQNGEAVNPGDQNEKDELYQKILDMSRKLYNNQLSVEELKELDGLLKQYFNNYGTPDDLVKIAQDVREKLRAAGETENTAADEYSERQEEHDETNQERGGVSGLLGKSDASTEHTPNDIIQGALDFKNSGDTTIPIDQNNIKKGYSTVYNILLSIGLFLAIAIGMYLGVKFMLANAEDKAKIKEAIIPYTAGCIIIFGAFVIWKLAIILLSGIEKVSDLPIRNEYVIAKQIDEK